MTDNSKNLSERDLIYYRLLNANKFRDLEEQRARALRKCFFKALFDLSVWMVFIALVALVFIAISEGANL
ncbi:MAG: hypothetical protein AAGB30_11215 [Pedobacter sp.]|nr:hypothetical protein [Pedobacter sp.]